MPREDIFLWWEYAPYASADNQRSEQYTNGEILNNPKPGAYAWVSNANEQRQDAFYAHDLAALRSYLQHYSRFSEPLSSVW